MTKDECYYLGYVSKTRGFDGKLILFLDVDDTNDYANIDYLLIDLHGSLTPFFIDMVWMRDNNYIEVHIEDIDARDDAAQLVGKELYLPLTELPKLPDDQYYLHELVGMTVIDAHRGDLGQVAEVFDHGNNPLVQIIHPKGEILIPIDPQFIRKVDKKAKRIEVDLPDGLIDINLS